MNEIQVLVEQKAGVINCNFEEIKAQLTSEMEFYKTLVFTEDQKADAKKDVASLRKLKTAIDDKRKDVKKTYMDPYNEFEKNVKELTSLIDGPINLINQQVVEFDAKVKAEKQEKIKEIYTETIGDMAELIPLDKIYKSEWENAKTSAKSIKADIVDAASRVKIDLDTIESFNSECGDKARNMYLSNGYNLSPVIAYIQQYEQQKKEMLEREKARVEAEKARIAEEEKKKFEEAELVEVEKEQPTEQKAGFVFDDVEKETESSSFSGFKIEPEQASVKTVRFTITGTDEQIDRVRGLINILSIPCTEVQE